MPDCFRGLSLTVYAIGNIFRKWQHFHTSLKVWQEDSRNPQRLFLSLRQCSFYFKLRTPFGLPVFNYSIMLSFSVIMLPSIYSYIYPLWNVVQFWLVVFSIHFKLRTPFRLPVFTILSCFLSHFFISFSFSHFSLLFYHASLYLQLYIPLWNIIQFWIVVFIILFSCLSDTQYTITFMQFDVRVRVILADSINCLIVRQLCTLTDFI